MPILSPKRQVTLPKELCDRLRVRPGDQLEFLEHNGRITILKKARGTSAAVLKRHEEVDDLGHIAEHGRLVLGIFRELRDVPGKFQLQHVADLRHGGGGSNRIGRVTFPIVVSGLRQREQFF